MATLINNAGVQHYANKMVLAENRKVGSKSLPTALNDIDNLIDEMKTQFDAEYGSALDMELENNENVFSVGTGTNVDKRSEVENSFTDVQLSGNSLVAIFNLSYTTTNEVTTSYYHIGTYKPNLQLKDDVYYTLLPINPLEYVYSIALYNVIDGEIGIGGLKTSNKPLLFKKNTNITTDILFRIYLHGNNTTIPAKTTFNFLVLEGDWTNKPIPQYFEGMKSVGQDDVNGHKIEILSRNKNLFDISKFKIGSYGEVNNGTITVKNPTVGNWDSAGTYEFIVPNYMKGKKLSLKSTTDGSGGIEIRQYDKNRKQIFVKVANTYTFDILNDCYSINLNFNSRSHGVTTTWSDIQLELSDLPTDYISHANNKKEISLNEPLRGLPNGVKDTIEKVNGEWKIVRRCSEIILNGSENWSLWSNYGSQIRDDRDVSSFGVKLPLAVSTASTEVICDNFATGGTVYNANDNITNHIYYTKSKELIYCYYANAHTNQMLGISIKNSKLGLDSSNWNTTIALANFKNWLSQNPTKVIYQLETPIIEDISPVTLQCWKNGTISIDEVLPVETTHTVALNKPAQIKRNIEELTALRKRVQALEDFYDQIALEQAHQLSLINHSIELDYDI